MYKKFHGSGNEFCARTTGGLSSSPGSVSRGRVNKNAELLRKHAKVWGAIMPNSPNKRPTSGALKRALEVVRDMTELHHSPVNSPTARRSSVALERSLKRLQKYSKRLAVSKTGGAPSERSPVAAVTTSGPVRVRHVVKAEHRREYRSIVTSQRAEDMCNAYGITVLEDGDWASVLDLCDGLFVARKGRTVLGFISYVLPSDGSGFPQSFDRLEFKRVGANGRLGRNEPHQEAARAMRSKAGAADDAAIFEIMVACKRKDEDKKIVKMLLQAMQSELMQSGDVIYAGATRGDGDGPRSPTGAWKKMRFKHMSEWNVKEAGYDQNIMVKRA